MSITLSDFIYIRDNTLTSEFCRQVIDKFETDTRSEPGRVGRSETMRVDTTIKDSLDLNISHLSNWEEEDKVFYESLNYHMKQYLGRTDLPCSIGFKDITDSGYQIQRTSPKAGYTWHDDAQSGQYVIDNGVRWATYIWYLNDVKKDGYTEFVDGTRVQPEAGKFVLFPACWPFIHRGYPPKSELKYIVTGWVHTL
jgi:hypothetical protein